MEFYKVLQEIMFEKSMSIPDVARASGLSDSTIRSIITRKSKTVALEVAFKISRGLSVSLERLNMGVNCDSNSAQTHEQLTNSVSDKKSSEGNISLTAHELLLIECYRKQPNMQTAVDRILNIPSSVNDDALVDDMANTMINAAEVSTINQIRCILKK